MKLVVDGPHGPQSAYAYTGGKPFDPALPCIVFVHGALNDHSVWTLLARWFAHHGHSMLAVDLPGHRRSAGPALTSVEDMAQWLLALLDAAGVQHAVLAGHSMGSLVALEAASRAPERALQLWMLGTAYPMQVSPALLRAALETPLQAIEMVTQWSSSTLAAKPSYPSPGVWLRGGGRALMRLVLQGNGREPADPQLFHTDLAACNAYAGAEAAAKRVACPAHLVLGRNDQMAPPRATAGLAQMLRATVHTVPAGHALMAEAPDAVLAVLRRALAGSSLPGTSAPG
jgi:pimeloyl-ACP methyl ester carboxylesterase